MSVTFRTSKTSIVINVENEDFDPNLPEHNVFNFRYFQEEVLPELNMANTNARGFLLFLGLANEDLVGTVKDAALVDLKEFLRSYIKAPTSPRWAPAGIRWVRYSQRLLMVVRVCIALKEDLVWS